jgi:hypothetical protein
LGAIKDLYFNHPCILIWPAELLWLKNQRRYPFVAQASGHESGGADLVFLTAQPGAALPLAQRSAKSALAVSGIRSRSEKPDRAAYESQLGDLQKLIRAGLSAAVFAELPDATQLGTEWLAETNARLFSEPKPSIARVLLRCGGSWNYTTAPPQNTWASRAFDDSSWKTGSSPFGDKTPGAKTAWTGEKLWARQAFELDRSETHDLFLKIANSDRVKIYLNGKLVQECTGGPPGFRLVPLAGDLLVDGRNTIAIESGDEGPVHWLDAGLHDYR